MSAQPTEVAVITKGEVAQAKAEQRSLLQRFGDRFGVDPNKLMTTLKATAFKGDVSNEQLMALMIVAEQHGLNPFLKEIHAFPSQGGIVPVVGVDGWARIINSHPEFNGMDFDQDDEKCVCRIHRKDREHPTEITEYMAECKRGTGPWLSHPKRMLRHKAMIQCARIAFSFAGIYDPDEAEAIVQAEIDVTPGNEVIPAGKKVGAVKLRATVEGLNKAVSDNDGKALWAIWRDFDSEQQQFIWGELRSYERSAIKKLLDEAKRYKHGDDLDAWSIEAMRACKEPATLETVWGTVQEAYAENDLEVPADVETCHIDRKAELGA